MSWRIIVISKRAKLDLQLGYMVVRSEEITKIVLSEISTILIESTAVSLFENDVKMYGIKKLTTYSQGFHNKLKRMSLTKSFHTQLSLIFLRGKYSSCFSGI